MRRAAHTRVRISDCRVGAGAAPPRTCINDGEAVTAVRAGAELASVTATGVRPGLPWLGLTSSLAAEARGAGTSVERMLATSGGGGGGGRVGSEALEALETPGPPPTKCEGEAISADAGGLRRGEGGICIPRTRLCLRPAPRLLTSLARPPEGAPESESALLSGLSPALCSSPSS